MGVLDIEYTCGGDVSIDNQVLGAGTRWAMATNAFEVSYVDVR